MIFILTFPDCSEDIRILPVVVKAREAEHERHWGRVVRVEVHADQLTVELKAPRQGQPRGRENGTSPSHETGKLAQDPTVLVVPWQKTPCPPRCRPGSLPSKELPNASRGAGCQ
jgi:hypothetical protein